MHASPPPGPPLVVLVHGAWHGAWCWSALQSDLDVRGIASYAIDLPGHGASTDPLTGLHGDAAALTSTLDHLGARHGGPIVLVGHSYGGAVITEAAADRRDIGHLVYVAAFALDAGESVLGALGSMERREVALAAAMIPSDDGATTTLDPTLATGALYGSCERGVVDAAVARLAPQAMSTMTEPCTGAPRRRIPSTYVVCAQDRAVHPDHQDAMATRCTERVALDTDHSPFISATGDLATIIETCVRGVDDER